MSRLPGLQRLEPVDLARTLVLEQGLYRGDYARNYLAEALSSYGVGTFADLHYVDPDRDLRSQECYRLVVMASDISHGALRRLPWDYHHYDVDVDPVPVADAVRASMSIPFFYRPVKLRDRTAPAPVASPDPA